MIIITLVTAFAGIYVFDYILKKFMKHKYLKLCCNLSNLNNSSTIIKNKNYTTIPATKKNPPRPPKAPGRFKKGSNRNG